MCLAEVSVTEQMLQKISKFPETEHAQTALSTILIWSITWIQWRLGICGFQAHVRSPVSLFPGLHKAEREPGNEATHTLAFTLFG